MQEQWCDNPVDPEVATGGRPLRQRRRTTYTYRAPFQLRLRQEFLDSGATTTILYLLQPEDPDSTRIYVCVLLSSGPGRPLHTPAEVAAQVALQKQILEEDVRSQATLDLAGLPLDLRAEVHVPADRLGVALRQALGDFMAAGRRQAGGGLTQSSGSSAPHAGQRVGGSSSARRPQAGQTRRAQHAGSPPSSSPWPCRSSSRTGPVSLLEGCDVAQRTARPQFRLGHWPSCPVPHSAVSR